MGRPRVDAPARGLQIACDHVASTDKANNSCYVVREPKCPGAQSLKPDKLESLNPKPESRSPEPQETQCSPRKLRDFPQRCLVLTPNWKGQIEGFGLGIGLGGCVISEVKGMHCTDPNTPLSATQPYCTKSHYPPIQPSRHRSPKP